MRTLALTCLLTLTAALAHFALSALLVSAAPLLASALTGLALGLAGVGVTLVCWRLGCALGYALLWACGADLSVMDDECE